MTHLPFVIASYGLAILVPVWFGIDAHYRLGAARRRLAAVDTRARRAGQ